MLRVDLILRSHTTQVNSALVMVVLVCDDAFAVLLLFLLTL